MRVLLLCHRPPLVPVDGYTMATRSTIDGLLAAGIELDVLATETHRHPSDTGGVGELARAVRYQTWFTDTRVTPLRALRGLAQESYNVERFDSPAGRAAVAERLASRAFDVVILDSLYSTPYLPVVRDAAPGLPVLLRAHNIEHHIWQGLAASSRPPRSWYLRHLARQLARYEARTFPRVDGIAAISAVDRATAEALAPDTPTALVEVGLAHRFDAAPVIAGTPLCSIASYDWMPNVDGMRWFLDQVWPLVRRAAPAARLDIAGRHSEQFAAELERPGVTVLGTVPSSVDFLTERGPMIAPLRSGSGIKIKLVEGMLLGRPIVTTSEGAAGLQTGPDEPMRVRDDPAGFAAAAVELLGDHALATSLGTVARRYAERRFSLETVTDALVELAVRAGTGATAPSLGLDPAAERDSA